MSVSNGKDVDLYTVDRQSKLVQVDLRSSENPCGEREDMGGTQYHLASRFSPREGKFSEVFHHGLTD